MVTARLRHGLVGESGCRNPGCICHDPTRWWPVCEEWMGYGGDFCPRCGWNRASHPTLGLLSAFGSSADHA